MFVTKSTFRGMCSVFALILASSVQAKDWKEITIGVEGAFPPFNMMASDGTLSGYEIDVAHEVCERAKLKCTIVAQDWDSLTPSLMTGKFDAILNMGPNEKRRQVMDFSTPYAVTANSFMVLKSSPLVQMSKLGEDVSVNDDSSKGVVEDIRKALDGMTVGAPLASSQQQFIEETFKGSAEVRTYKTSEQIDLDLVAGRIDAEFNNVVYLNSAVTKPANKDFVIVGPKFTGGVMATDVCFGIRKGESDLKQILDDAIDAAVADGTIKKFSIKWFGIDVSPKG